MTNRICTLLKIHYYQFADGDKDVWFDHLPREEVNEKRQNGRFIDEDVVAGIIDLLLIYKRAAELSPHVEVATGDQTRKILAALTEEEKP